MAMVWLLFVSVVLEEMLLSEAGILTTEQRLLKHVLADHDKLVRPVLDIKNSVEARFGIELIQLIKVDDRSQIITTKVWVRQSWTNKLLKWNATEWDGIDYLKVNPGDVWMPDVVLYDNAASEYAGGVEKYKTQIILYADGTHFWMSPAVFTSTCVIDIKYFPFDTQVCKLKFGSWTYDQGGINLKADHRNPITGQYINSSEWEIPRVDKETNVLMYSCCPNPYVDVTFKIHLHRKPLFYVFNVIAPCLVLSLTILFGFFFPPDSGERISFIITILLAIAVFMQMISGTLPVNSDGVPKLALFYMVILIESALSLGTTCVVLTFHYRSRESEVRPMPHWLRKYFILILARKLGYLDNKSQFEKLSPKKNQINNISAKSNKNNKIPPSNNRVIQVLPIDNAEEVEEYYKEYEKRHACDNNILDEKWAYKRKKVTLRKDNCVARSRRKGSSKLVALKSIQADLCKIVSGVNEQDRTSKINEEWKILGKVLDRIFFGIFLLTVLVSAAAILAPAYYHRS